MNNLAAIITPVKEPDEKKVDTYAVERPVAIRWFDRSDLESDTALAKFLGIGQSTISGIRDGTKGSRRTFKIIADRFGKKYEDYFKEGKPSTAPAEREGNAELMPSEEIRKLRERVAILEHRVEQLEKAGFPPQSGAAAVEQR